MNLKNDSVYVFVITQRKTILNHFTIVTARLETFKVPFIMVAIIAEAKINNKEANWAIIRSE